MVESIGSTTATPKAVQPPSPFETKSVTKTGLEGAGQYGPKEGNKTALKGIALQPASAFESKGIENVKIGYSSDKKETFGIPPKIDFNI